MKKFLAITLMAIALLCSVMLTACAGGDDSTYTLVAPDGAPALAIANLSERFDFDGGQIKLAKKVVAPSLIQDEALREGVDMAIVPANQAAKICNANGEYKMLATVTNGNLYVTSSIHAEVSGLRDLVGKMVYSIGQSSVPDIIFKSLLIGEGIEFEVGEKEKAGKVTVKYCQAGVDVISQLALAKSEGRLAFGIYAEPAVTKSIAKGFEEVLDLQRLWTDKNGLGYEGYAQAVLIARKSIYTNEALTAELLRRFADNADIIKQDPMQSVENIKAVYPQTSLQSDMTADVIARCNVKTVVAIGDGRSYLENTLQAIMSLNNNAIGGKLPGDSSYLPSAFVWEK